MMVKTRTEYKTIYENIVDFDVALNKAATQGYKLEGDIRIHVNPNNYKEMIYCLVSREVDVERPKIVKQDRRAGDNIVIEMDPDRA